MSYYNDFIQGFLAHDMVYYYLAEDHFLPTMLNVWQVEKIFRKSVEFCNESDVWKLNVAHVLFMQETKFKEATGFYEPIVKKHYDNVSDILLIVYLYLCNCESSCMQLTICSQHWREIIGSHYYYRFMITASCNLSSKTMNI